MSADVADAARLVAWGARPKERPARHDDYDRLVARYRDDSDFAGVCDDVAAGLGLNLVVDRDVGVLATADGDSPLRMPFSDFMRRTQPQARRSLAGLVVLAIAKVAYPQPNHLDDPLRVPRVTTAAVVEYLNRIVERLADDADDAEADRPEYDELWRTWDALRQARSHAERASAQDRHGLVKKVCRFLEEEGHLSALPSGEDGGAWRATPRFRLAVISMAEDSDIFGTLIDLDHYGDNVADSTVADGEEQQ